MTDEEPRALLVTLQARPGCADRLGEELAILAGTSRADAGCIRYDVLQDTEDRDRFVLWEEWIDEPSLADHNERSHVARFLETAPALLTAPMQVQRIRRAA